MIDRNYVEDVLREMGTPIHIKGFDYIIDALEVFDDRGDKIEVVKELYPAIAKKRETTGSRVERAIRHALTVTRELPNDVELVDKYIGIKMVGNTASLISLYRHIKREQEELIEKEHEQEMEEAENECDSNEELSEEDEIRRIVREEIFNIFKTAIGGMRNYE